MDSKDDEVDVAGSLGADDSSKTFRCRFYENQYPEINEVVMVNVTQVGEHGAYVTLTEYDNIDVCITTMSNYL